MKLSIGMMVKNEAKILERCLKSLQPLRDVIESELIIVDTGSEDNTVEIAKRYTDKVYFHKWNNHFSEMRNITINYATGEWFFVIDADEVLDEFQAIINFLTSPDDKKYNVAALSVQNITDEHDPNAFSTLVSFRLFRKTNTFRYEGAIHNQPVFDGNVIHLSAKIVHYGYLSTDAELMERKFRRTSAILISELEKDPENIYYLYQLSVTYGMYHNYSEALLHIEKAYQVFQKKPKSQSYMYLFSYMALLYHASHDYEKVEKICLESLAIKQGYIDIHYFLAEAQAVLGKYQDAVKNYDIYLDLLARYDKSSDRDASIIDYTLGNREFAYCNLLSLHKQLENYNNAWEYVKLVTSDKLIQERLGHIIIIFLKLDKYQELRTYYNTLVKEEWRSLFYQKLSETLSESQVTQETTHNVSAVFNNVNDEFGLYCQVLLENEIGIFSNETIQRIENIDFSTLPLYCSGIIYYLVKWHYPLEKLFINLKEIWISALFDRLSKQYNDLNKKVYEYLQHSGCKDNFDKYKLNKVLCRCALLLDKLTDVEYKIVFNRYIKEGISYLQVIYSSYVLDNIMVYEVKNDEEVFLIYMYHAQLCQENSPEQYLTYLRQALQAFPGMKRGIEMLLKEVQEVKQDEQQEFELYKVKIKDTIKELITSKKMNEAKAVLNEYKNIVPNDIEAVLLESKILLMLNVN